MVQVIREAAVAGEEEKEADIEIESLLRENAMLRTMLGIAEPTPSGVAVAQ